MNKTTTDKFAYEHPAMFPEQLVNDHIISWSNKGNLVYDPFMGSGTTAKMAIMNKRNWIGSEISEEYCKIIERRITFALSLSPSKLTVAILQSRLRTQSRPLLKSSGRPTRTKHGMLPIGAVRQRPEIAISAP